MDYESGSKTLISKRRFLAYVLRKKGQLTWIKFGHETLH